MEGGTFGEHLKREREMRGVSLEEIATATRIGTRFLRALENDQWDQLPGGVFNRGFVRAVARFLGLDEENLVAEYALAASDRAAAPPPSPRPLTHAHPAGPFPLLTRMRGLSWALTAVALAALATGGWFSWHRYAARRSARHDAASSAPAPQTTSPAALENVQPTGGSTEPAANAAASPPGTEPSSASAARSASPMPEEPATLELSIVAEKPAEVQVLADGKSVLEGKIAAGQSRSFHAREKFEIRASDSGAVLLELNGQALPPLGPAGSPGSITLTRQDLKKPSGGND